MPRPSASPVARWQIERGPMVTSVFHFSVQVEDELGRELLRLLDGTRDRAALVDELFRFLRRKDALAQPDQDPARTLETIRAELERNLQKLARLGRRSFVGVLIHLVALPDLFEVHHRLFLFRAWRALAASRRE